MQLDVYVVKRVFYAAHREAERSSATGLLARKLGLAFLKRGVNEGKIGGLVVDQQPNAQPRAVHHTVGRFAKCWIVNVYESVVAKSNNREPL